MKLPTLPDGTDPWLRVLAPGAGRLADAYGASYAARYLESACYNDYASPNGAHGATFLATTAQSASTTVGLASVQIWHESARRRRFGARDVAIMRLLMPAFRAGAYAQLQFSAQRHDLLSLLDGLGTAAIVRDAAGTVVHRTPAMGILMATDGAVLAAAVERTCDSLQPLAGRCREATPLVDEASARYARRRGDTGCGARSLAEPPAIHD